MPHLRKHQTEGDSLRHSLKALGNNQKHQHTATGRRTSHAYVEWKGIQLVQVIQWLQICQRYHFGGYKHQRGRDESTENHAASHLCKQTKNIQLIDATVGDFHSNYQFNLYVVLSGDHKSAGGSWEGAVEKAKSAQFGGLIEVLARLHDVDSLADYQR